MQESMTIDCQLGEDNTAIIRLGSQSKVIMAKVLKTTYGKDGTIERILLDRLVINISRYRNYIFRGWNPLGCYVTELERVAAE